MESNSARDPFALADDRVVAEHERDERHEVDHEAHEARDGHVDAAQSQRALLRGAEISDGERECREDGSHGEHPSVADAILQFLAGDACNLCEFDAHGQCAPR
jgi:hypothetical protein